MCVGRATSRLDFTTRLTVERNTTKDWNTGVFQTRFVSSVLRDVNVFGVSCRIRSLQTLTGQPSKKGIRRNESSQRLQQGNQGPLVSTSVWEHGVLVPWAECRRIYVPNE